MGKSDDSKTEPADRDRAMKVAERLRLPDWTDSQVHALGTDLMRLLSWQRSTFALAKKRRTQQCEAERTQAEREAEAFLAAAAALPEKTFWVGAQLSRSNDSTPGPDHSQAGLEQAVAALCATDPFPIGDVLLALARDRKAIARYLTGEINRRGDPGDDDFVKLTADMLTSHKVTPTCWKKDGMAQGNLVVACAMLRGDSDKDSLKAFWVVRTRSRYLKARREPPPEFTAQNPR